MIGREKEAARSVVHKVVTSYEAVIMSAAIDQLRRIDGMHVYSWLHDGFTFGHLGPVKQKRMGDQLRTVVETQG